MPQVPEELKITIGKIAAGQAVATDPGQNIMLTRSLLRWVKTGLHVKYNGTLATTDYKEELFKAEELWKDAICKFGSTNEAWPVALMMCADIADDMCVIAGKEGLIDYTQFNHNLTSSLYGNKDQDGEEEEVNVHARR